MFIAAQTQIMTQQGQENFDSEANVQLVALSIISAIGSLWVVISMAYSSKFRIGGRYRYVFFMACSQFLFSLCSTTCLDTVTTEREEKARFFFSVLFQFASLLWASVVTFNVPYKLLFGDEAAKAMDKYYHLAAWGIALFAAGGAVAGASEYSGGVCWFLFDPALLGVSVGVMLICLAVCIISLLGVKESFADEMKRKGPIERTSSMTSSTTQGIEMDEIIVTNPITEATRLESVEQKQNEFSAFDSDSESDNEPHSLEDDEDGLELSNVYNENEDQIISSLVENQDRGPKRRISTWQSTKIFLQGDSALTERNLEEHDKTTNTLSEEEKKVDGENKEGDTSGKRLASRSGYRSFVITLYVIITMFVSISMSVWALATRTSSMTAEVGILVFLTIALISLQGSVTFFVFGFEKNQKIVRDMHNTLIKVLALVGFRGQQGDPRGALYKRMHKPPPKDECLVNWTF